MLGDTRGWGLGLRGTSLKALLSVTGVSLLLVALLTAALFALSRFVDVETVTIIYLIAVLFAAIRGGVIPAIASALAAIGASAFFFYPPIYDFRVYNPVHLIDLVLFIVVAVVTGQLATNVRKAKIREQADALREALIGSVSHELRTPLASILGASTVICSSPTVQAEPRLAALANVVRDEAERLNSDIQNLLDASRISSEGVRPRLEWAEPADIVNAALERCRTRLAAHKVEVKLPDELPLILVDAVLIEQALGQILGNAGKYSTPGSLVRIDGRSGANEVTISVTDTGAGVASHEKTRLGERFFRGERHRSTTTGSGLGLSIATAFLRANGGGLDIVSEGEGHGTTVSIRLPVPSKDSEPPDLAQ